MSIVLLGLNHKSAPVEIREKVALSKSQIKNSAQNWMNMDKVDGIAILSTCNRTEFYFSTVKNNDAIMEVLHYISDYSKVEANVLRKHIYIYEDKRAVEHIFHVASGLDSMILGESQIQGQVQDAYNLALEAGISDSVINTLFMNALSVGKRVRTETYIDRQPVSISSAAVDLAKQKLGSLEERSVMILGAGETSELAAKHLVSNGISSVIVANRTFDRAVRLANEFNGKAIRLDEFYEHLAKADIVISCTAARKYIVEKDMIQPHLADRKTPLLFIDIAVPRDIDPNVTEIENVFLYDIDDIEHEVTQNLESRRKEAEKAKTIIEQELNDFFFWLDTLKAVPTIVRLRAHTEMIKEREVQKAINRIQDITPREKHIIEQLAHSMMNRWLHNPISNLKTLAGEKAQEINCYLNAVNDLFDLENEVENNENH